MPQLKLGTRTFRGSLKELHFFIYLCLHFSDVNKGAAGTVKLGVMKGFAALQGNAPVHLLVVIRNYLASTE